MLKAPNSKTLRRISTVAACTALVVGSVQFMQSGPAGGQPATAAQSAEGAQPVEMAYAQASVEQRFDREVKLPKPPEAALRPVTLPIPDPVRTARSGPDRADVPAPAPILPGPLEPRSTGDCDVTFEADTIPGSMVLLSLTAPCAADVRVEVAHEGLVIAERLSQYGGLDLLVPAMTEEATYTARIEGEEPEEVVVTVTDHDEYEHVALQWAGRAGPQLHALEFGAGYGDEGHLWSGAPGDIMRAAHGKGGFLTELGDPTLDAPRQAQVYTFPTGAIERAGDVALKAEVEVTELSCGRDITAEALQPDGTGGVERTALTVSVPDCDAIGGILVLKNLLQNLKIAGR
ncbi:translocase [Tranquillimonas alkanivorans]|uniref:Translocase n=1 Tax=Tranquillimonas alkanivorans TaxID=441119 RepID=A0A1I5LCA5_9RHOB|nr:translocase [Tranquillimonas alkanivorans]SFO94341.1 hypothetical protein SAMN04488047_101556 [Tranquillimonas alkanivorans]